MGCPCCTLSTRAQEIGTAAALARAKLASTCRPRFLHLSGASEASFASATLAPPCSSETLSCLASGRSLGSAAAPTSLCSTRSTVRPKASGCPTRMAMRRGPPFNLKSLPPPPPPPPPPHTLSHTHTNHSCCDNPPLPSPSTKITTTSHPFIQHPFFHHWFIPTVSVIQSTLI